MHQGKRTRGGLRKSSEEERHVPEIHVDCMFMGAFWVASNVVQRESTGEMICRRLMTWLRGIGLEFVDTIVKSDNKLVLTSLRESWSTLRAMKSGPSMIVENSPVGSAPREPGNRCRE